MFILDRMREYSIQFFELSSKMIIFLFGVFGILGYGVERFGVLVQKMKDECFAPCEMLCAQLFELSSNIHIISVVAYMILGIWSGVSMGNGAENEKCFLWIKVGCIRCSFLSCVRI